MTLDEERTRAVEARRGANEMRRRAFEREERFEPDGPPDSYWQPADDTRYRAEMRDAGRSGLLR